MNRTVNDLLPADQFKFPGQRKFRTVLKLINPCPPPFSNKVLIILNNCGQIVADPKQIIILKEGGIS